MKVQSTQTVEVHLCLSLEEAAWLQALLQNAADPEAETLDEAQRRQFLFNELKAATELFRL